MDTDKLCGILEEQALQKEKESYTSAYHVYASALRLGGAAFSVELTEGDGTKMVTIHTTTTKIFEAITDQLLASRNARIKVDVIRDFLSKFSQFQKHMLTIEQYIEREGEQ